MAEQLQVGETVQLKSGGPPMTVEEIEGKTISCVWFADLEVKHGHFVGAALKKFDMPRC
jgi:uncharacterized protein YodC (DUF2158 family)